MKDIRLINWLINVGIGVLILIFFVAIFSQENLPSSDFDPKAFAAAQIALTTAFLILGFRMAFSKKRDALLWFSLGVLGVVIFIALPALRQTW